MNKKKIIAVAAAAAMLVSAAVMPAGAESATWSLARNQTISYSNTLGLYRYGNVEYLKNNASSNDGVNLYLDYAYPGDGWRNAYHLFADPGKSNSAPSSFDAGAKASWRGNMCSWWFNGTGCVANGKFHAYN